MESQIKLKEYLIEIGLIFILMIDLFTKMLPIVPLSLLVLLYVALRCNFWEKTFLFLVYFPTTVGFVMNAIGVSGVGGWFTILGFLMLFYGYVTKRARIDSFGEAIVPFTVLIILFAISALTTSGGDYAMTKLRKTIIKGGIMLMAYLFFFSNFQKLNTQKIGIDYILLAALLLRLSLVVNNIPGPFGITDFSFLRYQTQALLEEEDFHIDYQNTGFLCVQGIGFYLMSRIKKINFTSVFILFVSLLVVLYLGSRQAIVTIVLMMTVWFFQMRQGRGLMGRLIILVFGVLAVYFIVQFLFSEEGALYSVAEEGYVEGAGRGPWLMSGIQQFLEHPVWGVGYGRFLMLGQYGSYPHNLFVELLCETGFIGFVIAMFLALRTIISNRTTFMLILYLFMAIFFRAMASGGLHVNIVLFSILFAMPAHEVKSKNTNFV